MSGLFLSAVVLFVAGLAVLVVCIGGNRRTGRLVGIATAALGVIMVLASSVTQVQAKSVGVQVSFGKPVHEFSPGLHWKSPWSRVVQMDGSTQIDDHLGDQRTEIRLGNQATGFVQNALRWKIKPEAAGELYAEYRGFDNIGPGLVNQELAAALNFAFSGYDPLTQAKAASGDPTAPKISNDQVADAVKARLVARIGDRIDIESVIIPKVDYDDATQQRINQLQQEIGNTRIAQQREQTAAAEAKANQTIADSVSKDPNVLVSKCLDQQREMIEKGQAIPVGGLGCWPDSGKAPVIVQQR
ncbi:SPFH domain-containing protein [Microlunatus flavus]|uniref:SPFH domain / Band 7 family protein n=1 Tax=Microlunatus flavus TaxID=1036181 RepID=A0A1H9MAL2_9ACTN|nr:SPFH domain-containing protein [Microlunatus flavus]SER20728.1 SPFH domain / Band 7 family protein [Microlunatus flavus]